MTALVLQDRPTSCTDVYWLEHCEGFRVDSHGEHLGYVEDVVWSDDERAPVALNVRRGFGIDGLMTVPVADVLELHADCGSIVVHPHAAGAH